MIVFNVWLRYNRDNIFNWIMMSDSKYTKKIY